MQESRVNIEDINNNQQEVFHDSEDLLLFYGEPVEVEAPENKESFLRESGFGRKKNQLPPLENKQSIDEILNQIFPPKRIEYDGRYFLKPVSVIDANRDDLKNLELKLEQKLKERQARKSGICPIREDLHNQLFDEIIRQSTINCPERGILLVKVRDNLRMTFAAYQTLYAGSIVFGVKKALQSEVGKNDLEKKIADLERKKIHLENKKIILENELDSIQRSFKEIRDLEDKRKDGELLYLKSQTKHLESFLKQVQANSN